MGRAKKLVVIIFILVMIMGISLTTYAKMEVDQIKNGVIRILAIDYDGEWWQGTGFAIGNEGEKVQYFITNYHVVGGMEKIYLFRDDNTEYELTITNIYDEDHDYAVVKTEEPIDEGIIPLVIETRQNGAAGDDVMAFGFPGVSDYLDSTFTGLPEDVTVTKGVISKVTAMEDGYNFYQTDAAVSHGNSGGPLINSEGHVIGINSFIMQDSEGNQYGYNGAYVLDTILEELDDNGLDYIDAVDVEAIEAAEMQKASEDAQEAIEKASEKVAEKIKKELKSSESETIGRIAIISIASVSVILVVVIIAVLSINSKKKKLANQPPQIVHIPVPQQVVVAPAPKIAQVVGTAGYHVGRVFNVEGIMTFGRNPESKIPYPADYKGISGNHCILQFDEPNQVFILSDMGSSYGTFLENGQKIVINTKVALSSGDKFYLADEKELFEVRYTS